jgi:putative FmdB family regulatory protein
MPLYEYRCAKCGEGFELFVRSLAERTAPICPKCGSTEVQKAPSLFGVGRVGGSNKANVASCSSGPT